MSGDFMDELRELMASEIVVEAAGTPDGYGDITYGSPQTITCRIRGGNKPVRDRNGLERTSTVQVWLDGVYGVTIDDRYTLPSPWQPTQPEAIDVQVVTDEDGPLFEKIMF
jgi:hypothetical protein